MKNFGILLLAMVSCCLLQAKNRVVKQPPFIARSSSTIEIDRVVVSDTATVLDIKAFFRPHNWIQISNESYLLADNGEKYPIRSGNGITLGEKFWMPDSGEASFSLIFPLLPPTVKVIDFIESDCEDCFKVWGIHLDGKLPELDLSDDVKKQKLNYDEPLPKAELKDGKSVITGRLLGYEKHYALPFSCRTCDLLTAKFEDTEIKVNEDGTFRTEIELCTPTTVSFSVGRDIYFDVFLVPGGELDMAVNLRELSRSESKLLKGKRAGGKKVYFSGTMAALNDEMITDDEHLMDVWGMVHWNMNDLYKNYYDNYRQYDDVYGYINYYNMDYNRMNPYYIKDYGAEPFVININEITKQNKNFRTALWTGQHLQITLMSINVGESIGLEMHSNLDQFIRIEQGFGLVQMGDNKNNLNFERKVCDDFAIVIPAGKWHNLTNIGNLPIKLYSIYAPPQHPKGTIHRTKADAEH